MKRKTSYIIFLTFLFFLPQQLFAQLLDRVIAVVNEDIITLSELEEESGQYLKRIRQNAPADKVDEAIMLGKQKVLDRLIDQRLITQEAEKAGVKISDQEFEAAFVKRLDEINLSQDELVARLKKSGLTEEKYKSDIRSQLLRDKLVLYEVRSKIIVTDQMINDFYANNYANEIKEGGYYLLQMGFPWGATKEIKQSEDLMAADKIRARKKAEQAHKMVMRGADFRAVARDKSELPSAVDGGDLGVFQVDEMASYMKKAVFPLKAGEISEILETPTGYQFFKLLSTGAGEVPTEGPNDSVREEIRKKLFNQKFQEEFRNWVSKIKEDSYIKKMLL